MFTALLERARSTILPYGQSYQRRRAGVGNERPPLGPDGQQRSLRDLRTSDGGEVVMLVIPGTPTDCSEHSDRASGVGR